MIKVNLPQSICQLLLGKRGMFSNFIKCERTVNHKEQIKLPEIRRDLCISCQVYPVTTNYNLTPLFLQYWLLQLACLEYLKCWELNLSYCYFRCNPRKKGAKVFNSHFIFLFCFHEKRLEFSTGYIKFNIHICSALYFLHFMHVFVSTMSVCLYAWKLLRLLLETSVSK